MFDIPVIVVATFCSGLFGCAPAKKPFDTVEQCVVAVERSGHFGFYGAGWCNKFVDGMQVCAVRISAYSGRSTNPDMQRCIEGGTEAERMVRELAVKRRQNDLSKLTRGDFREENRKNER